MNPLRRLLQSTALLGLAALGARAGAQTQSYVQKTKTINAAVLLLDADKPATGNYVYGQTAAPFAFHNLDTAKGIKPDDWNFVNPFAPGIVTDDIRARYAELYGTTAANSPIPADGNYITKTEGAYWTVRLSSLSQSQISTYNVLLVAPRYYLSLSPKERELLRRFVDGGGVLWVDLSATAYSCYTSNLTATPVDGSYGLPLSIGPAAGGGTVGPNGNSSLAIDGSSSVLNALQSVSNNDLVLLNTAFQYYLGPVASSNSTNDTAVLNEFYHYRQVVGLYPNGNPNSPLPVISQARVGDGAIVVTARGAAEFLNQGGATAAINPTQPPAYSNLAYEGASTTLYATGKAAARLAINIATLGGEGLQPGGSSHKTSGTSGDTPAPVLSRFNTEPPAGSTSSTYGPSGNGSNSPIPYSTPPNAPPVTYKGFIVATVGDQIVVMDGIPGRDADGDGDGDDGISDANGNTVDAWRDVSVGQPLDVIWISGHLGATLSAPVCAEVPEALTDGTGQSLVDQILVTDSSGNLYVFTLNQSNGASHYRLVGGQHNWLHKINPPTSSLSNFTSAQSVLPAAPVQNPIPTPPVVYDGIAYMVGQVSGALTGSAGAVWAVDLSTGSQVQSTVNGFTLPWALGSSLNMPLPTAEPTVGYIPITDNSGGVDRVMYLPGTYSALSTTQPAFSSIWLGAKGESPDSVVYSAASVTINTRAAAAGGIPIYGPTTSASYVLNQLNPHVSLVDSNGNPEPLSNYFSGSPTLQNSGNGVLVINNPIPGVMNATKLQDNNINIRVDYTIDWGASAMPAQGIVRGTLRLPIMKSPNADSSKRILGPIALTAAGTLHMIEATPVALAVHTIPATPPSTNPLTNGNAGDSYFAIREDVARGQFRVVSRYTLYSAFTQTLGGSPTGTSLPAVLDDADGVQKLSALASIPNINVFKQFRYAGGVSLRNGIAFAPINATRGGIIPVAMVAAFRAEPDTATLNLGQSIPTNPWLYQTDWARSSPQAVISTPTTSTVSGNSVVVDTDNGILSITNLATVVNGEITDCLNESQPVAVGSSLQAMTLRQPDALGDRWSPLLWFALWNGSLMTGTPFIGNNELFLPATSILPSVLNTNGAGPFTPSGVVLSVDADAPTSGLYATTLANTTNRPWITQQAQIVFPNPSNLNQISASPYFRMPQNVGIQTASDFVARVNQTKLGTSDTIYGLGGGDGIVTAATDTGLFGLSRADLVICDEGRLLEVDSAGNPVKNTFGGRFTGIGNGGTVANEVTLPRPVKAYPVGTSDTLVVDAGGNRIMRIGGDGSVERSVSRILLDPTYKPANYRVNEPLTFKDPRDATTFEGYVYKGATEVVYQQRPVEYWIHYLVADSGNGRLVELIDRFQVDSQGNVGAPISTDLSNNAIPSYDPVTGQLLKDSTGNLIPAAQVGVLVWQSPSLQGTANVGDVYNSVSRVFIGNTTSGGHYVYVAGVSRNRPTSVSAGLDSPSSAASLPSSGGGALVAFDPIGGTHVFDRISMPSLASASLFQPSTPTSFEGSFVTTTVANTSSAPNQPFRGVQSVTAESVFANGSAYLRAMVTDADAVYEFDIPETTLTTPGVSPALPPRWLIDEAAYTALRSSFDTTTNLYNVASNPLHFRPIYARRLDSGEVILVNGYAGLMRDLTTAYTGEVDLLDGNGYVLTASATDATTRNLGFTFNNVHLGLRTLTGIRGLVAPVFADRR